jgi:hypothetical protein
MRVIEKPEHVTVSAAKSLPVLNDIWTHSYSVFRDGHWVHGTGIWHTSGSGLSSFAPQHFIPN